MPDAAQRLRRGALPRPRVPAGSPRALGGAALLALLAAISAPVASPNLKGTVYTADEIGASVSAVDLASGSVTTLPLPVSPHNLQVSPDGSRLLLVGNPGHGHDGGHAHGVGRLLVFATADLAAPVADIEIGEHLAHVVTDAGGNTAFVTVSGADKVAVVDLAAGAVTGEIATGRFPHGMRLSPDGRELYVANVEDGSVSVIDVAGRRTVARIEVGKAPVQVGFLPDGTRAFVSLRDEDALAVIDTARRRVVARAAVGDGPIQVFATPDGAEVYVANQGSEERPGDTVTVVDARRWTATRTISVGHGAHGVAASPDGAYVAVTNVADGTLSIIDTASHVVLATYTVGAGPNGVSIRAADSPAR